MFAIFIHSDVHFCLRTHPTKGENAYATQHREKRFYYIPDTVLPTVVGSKEDIVSVLMPPPPLWSFKRDGS